VSGGSWEIFELIVEVSPTIRVIIDSLLLVKKMVRHTMDKIN